VPDVVRLPAPPGSNLLLEVEFAKTADVVWLATDAAAADRVPLSPAGNLRFQLNLADPRVVALLPADLDQGQLFVFATGAGATAKSPAIAWARTAADPPAPRCLLRWQGGTTTFARQRRSWLDPHRLEALEVQGVPVRQASVRARLGEQELPLVRSADQGVFVFENLPLLRERADGAATLEIEVRSGSVSTLFGFDLVPARLELRDVAAAFRVLQRRWAPVPGSRGWLGVSCDDVTMGQVLLQVTTADGTTVVAQRSVIERDAVEFALTGARYVLVVDKLVNRLIGEDHVELTVRPAAGFRPDRIPLLLHAVAASPDRFVREGEEFDGAAAYQFLLARIAAPNGRNVTLDQFVDEIASKSSKTGEPYQVRRVDGTVVTMQQWLRAELARIEAAAEGGKGEGKRGTEAAK